MLPLAAMLAAATSGPLYCNLSFAENGQLGLLGLITDGSYAPLALNLTLVGRDGWTKTEMVLDPLRQESPGVLKGADFLVRFTRRPALPVTVRVYADGQLRWTKRVDVPFWPSNLPPKGPHVGGRAPGIGDYVSRADDRLPVTTPRLLRVELTDARGRSVGATELALPGGERSPALATAIKKMEGFRRDHLCTVPPPPVD